MLHCRPQHVTSKQENLEAEAEMARTLREETLRRESEKLGRLMDLEDEEDIAADFHRVHISGDDSSGVRVYKPARNLRSKGQLKLKIPLCKTKIGSRAFTASAPEVWNEIPENLKSLKIDEFKRHLKSHYFKKAYPE